MPRRTLLAFFLLLSLAFNGCFAQQQHYKASRPACNLERITAQGPTIKIQSEAGLTEFWDYYSPEAECAAVEVERITVEAKGLVLPHHTNAAKIYFVIQGRAIHGTVVPGCAETFESPVQGQQGQQQGRSFVDRHQKLVRVTQGDVVAVVAGHTFWIYNDGDVPLVLVAVNDLANQANQLDLQYRRFWLAGNSQNQGQQEQGQQGHGQGEQEQQGQQGQGQQGQQGHGQGEQEQQGQQGQGQQGQHGQSQQGQGQQGQGKGQQEQQGQQGQGQGQQDWGQYENIWNGFDDELLSNILRVPQEIVRKLKGQQSNRKGGIVRAENLQLSLPEFDQEERQQQQGQQGRGSGSGSGSGRNGLEETICTLKIRENIAHPARADIYNPRAGRVSTVNSQTLPILQVLGLSALHANLYSNALWAPSWTSNANTVLYVIRGNARVQIVGSTGKSAFDGEVSQGQLIIVPQNFVVLKKAGEQGLEFIAFKTNDNALTTSLAGRLSALRALPEDIISVSFRIPKEEVRRLKYGREEALLLSGSESQGRRADA